MDERRDGERRPRPASADRKVEPMLKDADPDAGEAAD
jgi:hypothetical protein